jgi:3-oxoacyl-(acyl-carrier-protein) synthase/NADPH:quinone reductase-like Zn-dependent oxidoreductase/malonyl CoA-acyl carrier protein transacylase
MRDIRIIGMGLRAPSSSGVAAFEVNLNACADMTTPSRRYPAGYLGLPPRTGTLEPQGFDNLFFGCSAKQADALDPGIRILLHVVHEAILDSGIRAEDLDGNSRIGVYVGHCFSDHLAHFRSFHVEKAGVEIVNTAHCMAANKISYFYNLKGPSLVVDTACSSSLVAFDTAVRALVEGTIDRAIVGGISMTLDPSGNKMFHAYSMLSPTGRCYSFDERADGYCRSEGVAAVVLSADSSDKNFYCRVVGTGSNNNGHMREGITYPSGRAQYELALSVVVDRGLDLGRVRFVEAHGTGTVAGDREELDGLERLYGRAMRIGSVKSNMGHAEGASGILAVCKAVLMMRFGRMYGNHDFQVGAPKVQMHTEAYEFMDGDMIHINNFGFGGTNAVVFLEKMDMVCKYVSANMPYGFSNDPTHIQVGDPSTLVSTGMHAGLRYLGGQRVVRPIDLSRSVAVVFPGQGSNYENMCKELMDGNVTFRDTIVRLDLILEAETGRASMLMMLYTDGKSWFDSKYSTVGIVSAQIALSNILIEAGYRDAQHVLGHSIGEIAACYMTELLDERSAIMLAYKRSACASLMKDMYVGAMAAIGLTADETERAIAEEGLVETIIACYNAPSGQTISGPKEEVDRLVGTLKARGVYVSELNTDGVAYHCKALSARRAEVRERLNVNVDAMYLPPNLMPTNRLLYLSDMLVDAEYHVNNIVSPVFFAQRMAELPSDTLVIEVGPSAILTSQMKRGRADLHYFALVKKGDPERNVRVAENVGLALAQEGVMPKWVDLTRYHSHDRLIEYEGVLDSRQHFFMPTYRDFEFADGAKKKVEFNLETEWTTLRDHVVGGHNLFPAMGYVYALWKANEFAAMHIHDLKIVEGLVMESSTKKIELEIRAEHGGRVAVYHAGAVKVTAAVTAGAVLKTAHIPAVGPSMPRAQFYAWIRRLGYAYRNTYMALDNIAATSAVVRTDIDWVAYFDACLHLLLDGGDTLAFPTGIRSVHLSAAGPKSAALAKLGVVVWTDNIRVEGVTMAPSVFNYSTTAELRQQRFVPYYQGETDISAFNEIVRFCGGCVLLDQADLWPGASELLQEGGRTLITKDASRRPSKSGEFVVVVDGDVSSDGWIVRSGQYALYAKPYEVTVTAHRYTDIQPDGRVYCLMAFGAATSFVKTLSKEGYPATVVSNSGETGMLVNDISKDGEVGLWVEGPAALVFSEPPRAVHAVVRKPGIVESLEWVCGQQQKSHSISFAALNFRDVMRAYGQLREPDMRIGFEFSGEDRGQRVFGATTNGIANHCTPVYSFSTPDHITDEDAATIPVVYLTAYYALFEKAGLLAGDCVLIHAGSGGVGFAAINICMRRQIDVFTTCHPSKRQWVKDMYGLPDDRIGDSRSDSFVQTVLDGTGGRGVNCVLNSLSGPLLKAGFKCLAPGGTFCEIGKYDIMNDGALGLAMLERNISMHVIDLMPLLGDVHKISMWDGYLHHGFTTGEIVPLPRRVYAAKDTTQALRDMSQGKHLGKILIKFSGKDQLAPVRHTFEVSRQTHVITGGFGGLALALADRLSERGVERLALVGRSAPTGRWQQSMLARIRRRGTAVYEITGGALPTCDVDVVWHAATVYRDQMFAGMKPGDWADVLASKVEGALAILDKYPTAKLINISSIVSYMGNPGQTNYAWANGSLDDLGRDSMLTVQLGAVDNVGFVAQRDENLRILENADSPIRVTEIVDMLEVVYSQPSGVFSFYAKKKNKNKALQTDLASWSLQDTGRVVSNVLGTNAAALIEMADIQLDALGMDSLSRVELANTVKHMGGPAIPPTQIGAYTLRSLTEKICG